MNRMMLAAVIFAASTLGSANAAGPYDGEWKGGSPGGGRTTSGACPPITATATVADGKLSGQIQFRNYTYPFGGTIAADGSASGKWGSNAFTGKFEGNHFDGSYQSKECGTERSIFLDKAG